MATSEITAQSISQDGLENYLVAMARTVGMSVSWALGALAPRDAARGTSNGTPHGASHSTTETVQGPGDIFLLEPRINEMEILIDDRAVRLLREGGLAENDVRQIVATLKITNDLERMGDLAVNLAERVVSLAALQPVPRPPELEPMVRAVAAMVEKSLSALTCRNVTLASEVLESDDLVDNYRDQIFERLMTSMSERPTDVAPNLQLVLASRYLERLADHATNIAEDIIFWVRGLDVRHNRARTVTENS
jgi:phosphate transport system protein